MPHDPVDSSISDADSISRREFNRRFGAAAVSGRIVAGVGASRHVKANEIEPTAALPAMAADLCFLPATELVALLRSKRVSAREVMQAHLAQIERVNPKVNAIVTLVADRAMADAAKADESLAHGRLLGPLHGLPVAHKDLVDTAGIRTTRGSPFYRDFVPTNDALIVTRMRRAGGLTVGKTNTPGF